MNKRQNRRKDVATIIVEDITALNDYNMIIKEGIIVDASIDGFLMQVNRKDLNNEYQDTLSLDKMLGMQVALFLPQMNLDLDGFVMRTHHKGNGVFDLYIEFSSEVPDYWRECLVELLPDDEELEDMSYAS